MKLISQTEAEEGVEDEFLNHWPLSVSLTLRRLANLSAIKYIKHENDSIKLSRLLSQVRAGFLETTPTKSLNDQWRTEKKVKTVLTEVEEVKE